MPFSREEALRSIAGVHAPLADLLRKQEHSNVVVGEVDKYLKGVNPPKLRPVVAESMGDNLKQIDKSSTLSKDDFKRHVADAWLEEIIKGGDPQSTLAHLRSELHRTGIVRQID